MHYPALLAVLFRVVARVVARVIVSVIVVGSAAGAQAAGPLSGLQLLTAEGTRAVEDVHPLGTSRWLLARHDGLVLAEANDIEPIIKGSFESIDTRESVMIAGRALTLISVIDTDAGNVRLLSFDPDARAIVASRSLDYASAIPETQCLYRDPTSDNISLFTIDARGMLEQRYVYDGYQQAVIDLTVRRDIAVPEAQACAVDDNSGSLYVAEEPLGVWRYSASEESDPLREPVLLRSPNGALAGDVEDIAVDAQGVLWTLVQNPGRIYRTVPAGNGAEEWELPAGSEMIAIAPRPTDEALLLGLHDEASGQTLLARLDDSEWGSGKQASDKVLPVTRANTPPMHRILPAAQTAAVRRFGDAADDPAIFFDPDRPEKSLILGTDKREGLAVYALDGSRRQMLPVGRVNNVDVVTEVPLGERRRNIAAASNRSNNSISLFEIHAGELRHLADLPTGLDDVYGLCMYAAGDLAWVYINATDGRYEQYRLGWGATGPTAERVRQWRLPSQPEGCVADPLTGQLYMGEEAAGIWAMRAEPDSETPQRVINLSDALVADVEGMDVYRNAQTGYLVVSSQGSDSYAVFDLDNDYALIGAFRIVANLAAGVDGVSETDGLAVTSAALPGYPAGIVVVQDGRNRMPDAPQNFKIVDWRALEAVLPAKH